VMVAFAADACLRVTWLCCDSKPSFRV
jgi:hypothetical protein